MPLSARQAPASPELHHHNFALEVRELHLFATGCRKLKIRRGLRALGRLGSRGRSRRGLLGSRRWSRGGFGLGCRLDRLLPRHGPHAGRVHLTILGVSLGHVDPQFFRGQVGRHVVVNPHRLEIDRQRPLHARAFKDLLHLTRERIAPRNRPAGFLRCAARAHEHDIAQFTVHGLLAFHGELARRERVLVRLGRQHFSQSQHLRQPQSGHGRALPGTLHHCFLRVVNAFEALLSPRDVDTLLARTSRHAHHPGAAGLRSAAGLDARCARRIRPAQHRALGRQRCIRGNRMRPVDRVEGALEDRLPIRRRGRGRVGILRQSDGRHHRARRSRQHQPNQQRTRHRVQAKTPPKWPAPGWPNIVI